MNPLQNLSLVIKRFSVCLIAIVLTYSSHPTVCNGKTQDIPTSVQGARSFELSITAEKPKVIDLDFIKEIKSLHPEKISRHCERNYVHGIYVDEESLNVTEGCAIYQLKSTSWNDAVTEFKQLKKAQVNAKNREFYLGDFIEVSKNLPTKRIPDRFFGVKTKSEDLRIIEITSVSKLSVVLKIGEPVKDPHKRDRCKPIKGVNEKVTIQFHFNGKPIESISGNYVAKLLNINAHSSLKKPSITAHLDGRTSKYLFYPKGFAPFVIGPLNHTGSNKPRTITHNLQRGISKKLIIQDDKGQPVPNASISPYIQLEHFGETTIEKESKNKTNINGTTILEHLADAPYKFHIKAENFFSKNVLVTEIADRKATFIQLRRIPARKSAKISLQDQSGKPVAGAKCYLLFRRRIGKHEAPKNKYLDTNREHPVATTNSEGKATINGLIPGFGYTVFIVTKDGQSLAHYNLEAGKEIAQLQLEKQTTVKIRFQGDINTIKMKQVSFWYNAPLWKSDNTTYCSSFKGVATISPTKDGGIAEFSGMLLKNTPPFAPNVTITYTHKGIHVSKHLEIKYMDTTEFKVDLEK